MKGIMVSYKIKVEFLVCKGQKTKTSAYNSVYLF